MNNSKKKCEICSINENKYKCPKCLVLYCSLNCYKTHKDACLTKQSTNESNQNTEETTQNETTTTSSIQVESISKIIPEETEFKDVSSDFVSADKLKLLGESSELKEILNNKHLKELLINLNGKTTQVDKEVERLMQEPLFQEFSDACLKIVQNKSDLENAELKIVNK